VTNFNGVQNHTDNRHGIDGYLDDSNVAANLLDDLITRSAEWIASYATA
jgi:hypothetical protein